MNQNVQSIVDFVTAFQATLSSLGNQLRWGHNPDRTYRQTTLHHSISIAILVAFCLDIEKKVGKHKLDDMHILTYAIIHDFGESIIGDMTYQFKQDPRLKYLVETIEEEATLELFKQFSFASKLLQSNLHFEPNSLEQRFFNAMERLDYTLYAITEYYKHGNESFLTVIIRQYDTLCSFADEFPSVAAIFTQKVRDDLGKLIKDETPLFSEAKIKPAKVAHVDDLLIALEKLLALLPPSSRKTAEAKIKGFLKSK